MTTIDIAGREGGQVNLGPALLGDLMATPPARSKARNIAARPQVTVTVEDRTYLGWVSAQGRAELTTDRRRVSSTTGSAGRTWWGA